MVFLASRCSYDTILQTEVEAVAAAAASRFSGDITWDKAVVVAMSEDAKPGEGQQDREARVLKSVLEAGIVPDNEVEKVREALLMSESFCPFLYLVSSRRRSLGSPPCSAMARLKVSVISRDSALQLSRYLDHTSRGPDTVLVVNLLLVSTISPSAS